MIPDRRLYLKITGLRERIARVRLLSQLARDDADIGDLLTFAHRLGDTTEADSLPSFRMAQAELLRAARTELRRLNGPE
mgnify:CR=1 FL=1